MTARTKQARTRARAWPGLAGGRGAPLPDTPATVALVAAAVAAGFGIVGPLLPVVRPAHPAGYLAEPMLALLALLPLACALVAVRRGRRGAAMALLAAVATFAPGRLVTDLQLAADVGESARPELVLPTSLAALHPGIGLWLLVAGQAALLVAGPAALRSLRHAPGTPLAEEAQAPGSQAPGRQGRLAFALCCGVAAAIALLGSAPFHSADPFLLGRALLDRPALVLAGGALLMAAAVLAPAVAAASGEVTRFAGASAGTAIALLFVALPNVVSGVSVDRLRVSWGPCVVLAVAAAFAVAAATSARAARAGRAGSGPVTPDVELALPSSVRLRATASVLGIAAGLLAVAAGLVAQVSVAAPLPQPDAVARWPLVPAGALVAMLALGLAHPGTAGVARPAFAVAATAIPLAAAADLDFVLTAARIDGVSAAAGPWLAGLAVLVVLAATCSAGLVGGAEREEVDLSVREARPAVFWSALLAVALAVAGFGLPVERASGYTPPGLWSNFRFTSWGMVLVLVALCAAAVVAAYARPSRAAALLLGGAAVMGVRCAELPLTAGRAPGTTAGAGEFLSLAAVAGFAVAAAVSVSSSSSLSSSPPSPPPPRSGR